MTFSSLVKIVSNRSAFTSTLSPEDKAKRVAAEIVLWQYYLESAKTITTA